MSGFLDTAQIVIIFSNLFWNVKKLSLSIFVQELRVIFSKGGSHGEFWGTLDTKFWALVAFLIIIQNYP